MRKPQVRPRSRRPAERGQRDWHEERRRFLEALGPESHFHCVFDGFDDIYFFAKNLAGETLFFSQGILHHHSIARPEQMLGKTDDELTPGPLADHYREDDQTVIRTGQPLIGRLELWHDDVGLPDWFVVNKFPLFDRGNRVVGVMGTLRVFRGVMPTLTEAAWLTPAMSRLRESVTRFPRLTDLAAACGMSVRQLQRSFRDIFGMSPRTYWMKCRVRLACQRLRAGSVSIAEVASELGFCDQSNFTHHFHRHTGRTPRQFIRNSG